MLCQSLLGPLSEVKPEHIGRGDRLGPSIYLWKMMCSSSG